MDSCDEATSCYADEVLHDLENVENSVDLDEILAKLDEETAILQAESSEARRNLNNPAFHDSFKVLQDGVEDLTVAVSELEEQVIASKERQRKIMQDADIQMQKKRQSYASQLMAFQEELNGKQKSLHTIQEFAAHKDEAASTLGQLRSDLEAARTEYEREMSESAENQDAMLRDIKKSMEKDIDQTTRGLISTFEEGKSVAATRRVMMETERLRQEEMYQTREERKLRDIVGHEQDVRSQIASAIHGHRSDASDGVNEVLEYRKRLKQLKDAIDKKKRKESPSMVDNSFVGGRDTFLDQSTLHNRIQKTREMTAYHNASADKMEQFIQMMASVRSPLIGHLCDAAGEIWTGIGFETNGSGDKRNTKGGEDDASWGPIPSTPLEHSPTSLRAAISDRVQAEIASMPQHRQADMATSIIERALANERRSIGGSADGGDGAYLPTMPSQYRAVRGEGFGGVSSPRAAPEQPEFLPAATSLKRPATSYHPRMDGVGNRPPYSVLEEEDDTARWQADLFHRSPIDDDAAPRRRGQKVRDRPTTQAEGRSALHLPRIDRRRKAELRRGALFSQAY